MANDGPSPHFPFLRLGLPEPQPSRRRHAQSLLGPSFYDPRTPHVLKTLLVACGCRRRPLVVDAHRVACVAGQLRQDIQDMILASGGFCLFFASKHVISLRIKS